MKTTKKAVRKAAESRKKTIKVTVEPGNVLKAAGDVLALKYAQARHGADRGAAELFRAAGRTLPKPMEWEAAKLVDSPKGITARQTLVVGTHHLWEYEPEFRYQFGYGDVRRLNEMFLSALVDHPVKSVVTTPHGEGVDLDSIGVFESAIRGFQSAMKRGQFPHTLERVSIVTKNPEKRNILRQRLDEILPNGVIEVGAPITPTRLGRHDVFVIMSFHQELESLWSNIEDGVHKVKWGDGRPLSCVRLDHGVELMPGQLLPQILRSIGEAKFVIAVLTPAPREKLPRPNVAFEVGCAREKLGGGKVLLVADKKAKLREKFSDLAGEFWFEYDSPDKLADEIRRVLAIMAEKEESKKRK